MRTLVFLLALGVMLIGPRAYAEPANAPAAQLQERTAAMKELLVQAQANTERVVRQIPAGLTNAQVWGIAAGIVAGGMVADLLGASGIATLALVAGGGALGNWLLSS